MSVVASVPQRCVVPQLLKPERWWRAVCRCVVDAKHLMQHLEDGQHGQGAINEAIQQLAFSDIILLNKTDLVSEADKADVLLAIKRINNTARIIECQLNADGGRPPLEDILGTNSFSVQRALTVSGPLSHTHTAYSPQHQQCLQA